MIDFDLVLAAALPCFGTPERALTFLTGSNSPGAVYPPS
jgi:hypothetical protein